MEKLLSAKSCHCVRSQVGERNNSFTSNNLCKIFFVPPLLLDNQTWFLHHQKKTGFKSVIDQMPADNRAPFHIGNPEHRGVSREGAGMGSKRDFSPFHYYSHIVAYPSLDTPASGGLLGNRTPHLFPVPNSKFPVPNLPLGTAPPRQLHSPQMNAIRSNFRKEKYRSKYLANY